MLLAGKFHVMIFTEAHPALGSHDSCSFSCLAAT
jgi:hypothetical protein